MTNVRQTPTSVRILAVATALLFVAGIAGAIVTSDEPDDGGFVFGEPQVTSSTSSTSTTVDLEGPGAVVGGGTSTTRAGTGKTGTGTSGGAATTVASDGPTTTAASGGPTTTSGPAGGGTRAPIKSPGVYVIAPDGTGFRPIAQGGYNFPTWSPQGDRIAYGVPNLRVVASSGGASTVAGSGTLSAPPSWHRDGSQLAFVGLSGGHFDLYVTGANGSGQRLIADHNQVGEVSGVSWSPNGEPIAFVAGGNVWVVKSDGSGLRQIATGVATHRVVAFSPDGLRIAFTSLDQLLVVDLNGTNLQVVANTDRSTHSWDDISWSPDSTRLAFQAGVGGVNRVRVVGRDGTRVHTIAESALQPSFAPDGKRVAVFTAGAIGSNGDRTSDLVLANPDRSDFRQRVLYDEPGAHQSWGPAYSPSGGLLLFAIGGNRNAGPPAPSR